MPPTPTYDRELSAIQHSAWRSPDGDVGVVVTNISERDASFTLELDPARLALKRGEKHVVRVVTEKGTQEVASDVISARALPLQLAAGSIALVTLSPAR